MGGIRRRLVASHFLLVLAIVLVIGLAVGLTLFFGRGKDEAKDKKQPAAEVTDRPFRGGDSWHQRG